MPNSFICRFSIKSGFHSRIFKISNTLRNHTNTILFIGVFSALIFSLLLLKSKYMKRRIFQVVFSNLNKEIEMLVFGHAGYPVILFPTQWEVTMKTRTWA
jgi:hypothetical protein